MGKDEKGQFRCYNQRELLSTATKNRTKKKRKARQEEKDKLQSKDGKQVKEGSNKKKIFLEIEADEDMKDAPLDVDNLNVEKVEANNITSTVSTLSKQLAYFTPDSKGEIKKNECETQESKGNT